MAQLGNDMLADHLPKSQRLSLLTKERIGYVSRMISVFVAGLGLVSLNGDLPPEMAIHLTEDMYQMAVNHQLAAQMKGANRI